MTRETRGVHPERNRLSFPLFAGPQALAPRQARGLEPVETAPLREPFPAYSTKTPSRRKSESPCGVPQCGDLLSDSYGRTPKIRSARIFVRTSFPAGIVHHLTPVVWIRRLVKVRTVQDEDSSSSIFRTTYRQWRAGHNCLANNIIQRERVAWHGT